MVEVEVLDYEASVEVQYEDSYFCNRVAVVRLQAVAVHLFIAECKDSSLVFYLMLLFLG